MINEKTALVVGRFGSCYGVKGWIRLHSFMQNKLEIFSYHPVFIKEKKASLFHEIIIESWKWHKSDLIVKLRSIDDCDKARNYVNLDIFISSSLLPILAEDDYYWHDLIGCEVSNTENYVFGNVIDLIETGSNDVLVVKVNRTIKSQKENMNEILIPFIRKQTIKHVDIKNKQIVVDWSLDF